MTAFEASLLPGIQRITNDRYQIGLHEKFKHPVTDDIRIIGNAATT
ncbi:hypothetical protein ANMWB30_24010 [Arthrobacter sp. MWB30]|nr:hypothetical protein ANMWB30_24010 [Arthrobacter sp. MWB30]